MILLIPKAKNPPIVWDIDVYAQMAIGNTVTMVNLVNFTRPGMEFNPAAGSPLLRTNNPTGLVPVCDLADIGTVWAIGNNANRQFVNHLTAQFPTTQLPPGVRCPVSQRVTIWSAYLRFLNAPAGGFGRFQGFGLIPIVGTNRFTANTGNTTGFQVGVFGNLAASPNAQLSLISKRASANGPHTTDIPIVWPRALDQWTLVELVVLGATAQRPAQLQVWLDGAGVTGAVISEPAMPNVAESLNSGGWVAMWDCDASAHANMVLQVAVPRLRQGRFLPNGVELFE